MCAGLPGVITTYDSLLDGHRYSRIYIEAPRAINDVFLNPRRCSINFLFKFADKEASVSWLAAEATL